jgi:predicted nucleic acid-binding protein
MVLVDTSVWIDHLRRADPELVRLLNAGRVLCHSLIVGEIAMGNLKARPFVLGDLHCLPRALEATHQEALVFLTHRKLFGLGLGYIDVCLLASVQLTPSARLWTRDKRLLKVAESLGLAHAAL